MITILNIKQRIKKLVRFIKYAMGIAPIPTPPSRNDPATFSDRADDFLDALTTFTTEAQVKHNSTTKD